VAHRELNESIVNPLVTEMLNDPESASLALTVILTELEPAGGTARRGGLNSMLSMAEAEKSGSPVGVVLASGLPLSSLVAVALGAMVAEASLVAVGA
jgi:hypothetical protein